MKKKREAYAPRKGRKPPYLIFLDVFGEGLFEEGDGLFESCEEFASGGVGMSAAVEDLGCPDVNGSVSLRAEGDADAGFGRPGFGSFFAHEDGIIHIGDLEGHVDQSFGIAYLIMIAVEFVGIEGDEGEVVVRIDAHLPIEGIAGETDAIGRVLIEDGIVDLVFLYSCAKQIGDDIIEFGAGGIVGKIARIRHQSCIYTGCY